jgi:hypothetical protein
VRTVLRQHRRTLWIVGPLVALTAVTAVVLRVWWQAEAGAQPFYRAEALMQALAGFSGDALLFLPVAVGAFVAGPLIARELESGTYKTAWTQSVSPARWLTAKLALALAGAVAAAGLLVLAFRLLRGPFAQDRSGRFHWYDEAVFPAMGPAALGYTVLGVTLGALIALLARHTLLAMFQTALAVSGVMLVLRNLRQDLWPVRTRVAPDAATADTGTTASLWGHGSGWQTATGERLDLGPCDAAALRAAQAPGATGEEHGQVFEQCVADRGGVTAYFDYHAPADFWPLQLVETGLVLAMAALAGWLAFRALRRLHG